MTMAAIQGQYGSLIFTTALPSVDEYISALQTCRKTRDLSNANSWHAQICKSGLELHESLGSCLIPMYVDCGSVFQAKQVFCKMHHPSERAWTSMILGCVESNNISEAFDLYEEMQIDSIWPSGQTYLALLKACVKLECPRQNHDVHTEIVKGGYDVDIYVANALIDMHAKCGLLEEAQSVFEMLPARDVVSWNALMAGCAAFDLIEYVFELFHRMQADCIDPNERTFLCLLNSCANEHAASRGQEVHNLVSQEGLEGNVYVGSALVDMYAKCDLLKEAQDVFDDLPSRNIISWTALISVFAKQGLVIEAYRCLKMMHSEGVSPNSVTWMFGLKACQNAGMIGVGVGQAMHDEIVKCGLDLVLGSSVVAFYAECGLLRDATQVFSKLIKQDPVSCTALSTGYIDHGLEEEALNCLDQMDEENSNGHILACIAKACGACKALDRGHLNHAQIAQDGFDKNPVICNCLIKMYMDFSLLAEAEDLFNDFSERDIVSWSALISGYNEHNFSEAALSCFFQMQVEGFSSDDGIFVDVLRACGDLQAIETGFQTHCHVILVGFTEVCQIDTALIAMYARCGGFDEARQLIHPVQGVQPWNAIISEYVEKGRNKEAVDFLWEMRKESVCPDHLTYVHSLKACGNLQSVAEGQVLHAETVKKGFDEDPLVANALVMFYLMCGLDEDTNNIFASFSLKDVITWNSLLRAHADKGAADDCLVCLTEMQLEDISPNTISYIETLRSCSRSRAANEGLKSHAQLVKPGFDSDLHVSNSLVNMYAMCGLLAEARWIFDKMPMRPLVAWSGLMAGYVDHGFDEEAVDLLGKMKAEILCLDSVIYSCSLNVCGRLEDIDRIQNLHAEIVETNQESDPYVGSALVDCYAKCGLVKEAQDVFDEMVVQDASSWSSLMNGYIDCDLHFEALVCLDKLLLEEVDLDAIALTCGLKACGKLGVIEKGWKVHSYINKEGFEENPLVSTTMVNMYSKCGLFEEALEIFDSLLDRDTVSWNALLVGHVEHGAMEKVLGFFDHMQLEGVIPNVFTFIFCFKACSTLNAIERGQKLHSSATELGLDKELLLGNLCIEMYAECRLFEEACHVHENLPLRDTASWNALIMGYVMHDFCTEAISLFEEMQNEVLPNARSFASILACCKSTDYVDLAQRLHTEIVKEGFQDDLVVAKSLIIVYSRNGFLEEVQELFSGPSVQDANLWGEILMCYASKGESERVFGLNACMQEQGILPSSKAFMTSLQACGNLLALQHGKRIHAQLFKVIDLLDSELLYASALVDMYGKCGSMVDAQQEFNMVPKEDVTVWNALITGYARQGKSDLVFHSFQRMIKDGIFPDEVTFLLILTVCSHAGLVEKGQTYFEVMVKKYDLAPAIKHRFSLIDLLGRTGQLDEAVILVADMQSVVDNATLHSMWDACLIGDFKLGSDAFDRAATLEESEVGDLALMSNMYA